MSRKQEPKIIYSFMFTFATPKAAVKFVKYLSREWPSAVVAEAGDQPHVVRLGIECDSDAAMAFANSAVKEFGARTDATGPVPGNPVPKGKAAKPEAADSTPHDKVLAQAERINAGDAEAIAEAVKLAALRDGEQTLVTVPLGQPYLTRKGRLLVATRPVIVDSDDAVVVPCREWNERGQLIGMLNEPLWLAVHPVPADEREKFEAIISGKGGAKSASVRAKSEKPPKAAKPRDPRLPPVGTVMTGRADDTADKTRVQAIENADGTFTVTDLDSGSQATGPTLRAACMTAVVEAKWARARNAFCIPYRWFNLNPKTAREPKMLTPEDFAARVAKLDGRIAALVEQRKALVAAFDGPSQPAEVPPTPAPKAKGKASKK